MDGGSSELDVTHAHFFDETLPYDSSHGSFNEYSTPTTSLPLIDTADEFSQPISAATFLKEACPEDLNQNKKRTHGFTMNETRDRPSTSPRSPIKKLSRPSETNTPNSPSNIEQEYDPLNNLRVDLINDFNTMDQFTKPIASTLKEAFTTPAWNPSTTPTRSALRKRPVEFNNITPINSPKLSWREVSVYYFGRAQGVDTVPHEGEISLGMQTRHHTRRSFPLIRKGQPYIGIDDEVVELSSDEEEPPHFERNTAKKIQGMSRQQIAKLLKVSGVNVERAGLRELELLRESRRSAGCSCPNGICLPETCQCALDGIKCQWDGAGQDYGPCPCDIGVTCENPEGRVEFNQEKVAAHHMAARQRWKDSQRTGNYSAPSRRRLDSEDQTKTYCETPPNTGDGCGYLPTLRLGSITEINDIVVLPEENSQLGEIESIVAHRPKPSPRKTPTKPPTTPTRRQPLRTASLSRLNTPTKITDLETELPIKLRLRRSSSTSAMENPTEEKVKTPRMRRSSSVPRSSSTSNLAECIEQNKPDLPPIALAFQTPTSMTASASLQRSISRVISTSRLRPATASFVDLLSASRQSNAPTRPRPQNETATPLRMNYAKVQIPSPPPNCISPDDDFDRPTPLPRFPVTPVYSRIKPSGLSRLTPAASSVHLQPFKLNNEENNRLTPSKSIACLQAPTASTNSFNSAKRLTPSKSTIQLPMTKLNPVLNQVLPNVPPSPSKRAPPSPRKFPKTSSLLG
ncbi:unnamed protein product, partial [Mesorhabditis belari]|uniref:Cysteine/serine-rich nuclear protein N-terminal domain-containing protein n=1 Tax=Mesorhabditis belari TaxID=2138241 RepID=A0AAF3EJ85_9BILA